jgi:ketosteroid isomerase-like protein
MPSKDGNTTSAERRAFLMLAAMAPAAALASQAPVGNAAMPAELAASVAEYRQATMRGDIAALSALVADDYILVNSDSSLQAKASYLADFGLPGFRIERYAMEQPAHVVWGNTALVRGLLHLGWMQDGSQHTRVLRIAHVWHKCDGRWRLAYTQLTRVPDL